MKWDNMQSYYDSALFCLWRICPICCLSSDCLSYFYLFVTKVFAIMSWSACFLRVKPAMMNPIHKIIPDTNLPQYLPFALSNEIRLPLMQSLRTQKAAYLRL